MAGDSRRSSSSQKHWKLNWWDLWPLVDGERRPIRWTNDSLILSPHPLSPTIVARRFPSQSSFTLPLPTPILNNPSAFAPPSVLEVSPEGDYVFAFFEAKSGENMASIWHREECVDKWKVNISWYVKRGQGIVLAKWLGEERMWIDISSPSRGPPLGPKNILGTSSLLLVTQSHVVQIVHRMAPSFPFQAASASLRYPSQASLVDRTPIGDPINGRGGLTVCIKAAIGMGYNELSIIIATVSTVIPPASVTNTDYSDPFGVPRPPTPPTPSPSTSWENFGPEQTIHLCEVKITAYNYVLGLATKPLPPLFPQVTSSSRLADVLIVPHIALDIPSSPEGSVIDKDSLRAKEEAKSWMHILLAYMDFEDYLSPRSDLLCFELKRGKIMPTETSKAVTWSHRHLKTRTITDSAVSFLLPFRTPGSDGVVAGLLDLEGSMPRLSEGKSRPKQVRIGKIVKLDLPHLMEDENWEISPIMASADDVGTDPPISAVTSPRQSFICTSPARWSSTSKLGVHLHPRQKNFTGSLTLAAMSERLASAILSDKSPTDIAHLLSDPANPTFQLPSVGVILEQTLRQLDSGFFPEQDWHFRIAGVIVEILRTREKRLREDTPTESKEKTALDERWHVALDICSVKALKNAFEACREEDGYDLDPVWHLTALLTWLVDFTEKLLRTCVLWEGGFIVHTAHNTKEIPKDKTVNVKVKMEAIEVDHDGLLNGDPCIILPSSDSPIHSAPPSLIHLIHPYLLDNLIAALSHLNTFRAFIETLTASKLTTGIAKEVVVDVIDCSGINFKECEVALRRIKELEEFKALDADVLRQCFCSLSLMPLTQNLLVKACNVFTSSDTVSKPRLFMKSSDLVDGISKLDLASNSAKQERDIISKGALGVPGGARTCERCNGKTETGQSPFPRGREISVYGSWAVWENEWQRRCICGGAWITTTTR